MMIMLIPIGDVSRVIITKIFEKSGKKFLRTFKQYKPCYWTKFISLIETRDQKKDVDHLGTRSRNSHHYRD